jgi:uncharacterized damage-inducible protein DinB
MLTQYLFQKMKARNACNYKVILFLNLLSVGFTNAQSSFKSDILEKWKGMKSYTLEVAAAMPEEKYNYKPTTDEPTFAYQLVHMAGNMHYLSAKLINNIEPSIDLTKMEKDAKLGILSKTEIVEIVSKAFDYVEKTIESQTESNLNETLNFWGGVASKRKILLLLNDHQTHHRGQLVVYLRLSGIVPPKYIGW